MNYEDKALQFAEKYGIIAYEVDGNKMSYTEQVEDGIGVYGIYESQVNLDTMEETRVKVDEK